MALPLGELSAATPTERAFRERNDNMIDNKTTQEIPAGIHNYSSPDEKVELFLSLFAGREDLYAKRWESAKTGKSGYIPVCYKEWTAACPKSNKGRMRCGDCRNRSFARFDADAAKKHLTGKLTIGVYPMLTDQTCRFLVFDFDGDEYSPDELFRDISAICDACIKMNICMAVERSRSGKGMHFWIFFSENIPVVTARKFGSSLITHAMNSNHTLSFKTYDRLIPSQDTMPKGGFGNLIALPLQKLPRGEGNSVFVDENLQPYPDQWSYLYNLKRYDLYQIESFIRQLAPMGELGILRNKDEESDNDDNFYHAKPLFDFPSGIEIIRSNMLYIKKEGISSAALNLFKRLAAFRNPEFYKSQAMRMSTHNKPRVISCSEETEQYLCLPRGLEDELRQISQSNNIKIIWKDKTNQGRHIKADFDGRLRDEQQQAADALIRHDNGILSATTAFGKTVIGAYLIARRRVNTLILVHRTSLLSQWIERLNEFLVIDEELPIEFTPTGRKKKKEIIGQIGGGKTNPSGIVDVAIMQSLVSGDQVKDIVKDYGMVIADECHHVSAFSFERILKAADAKYVYGLTATPTRQDGHHPIITMQCGKIRYRVDAISQAEERPFEHYIIPRFTRFKKPAGRDETKWTITDIYRDIQNSEVRNSMIVRDVLAAVEQGRNPIVLTERKDHVKILTDRLSPKIKNVIPMTGGTGQKKSRETLQTVADIPANEPFVLIATGKYVGEGFDMPRLDTLFLTMPVSWKGIVQQYAGRLHRFAQDKKEVQIYDYVDIHEAMPEKMYQKRLKGYASIGYKAKATPHPTQDTHSIFDSNSFVSVYSADITAAVDEIYIVSPFLTKQRVLSSLHYLTQTRAKVTVVTKPPDDYEEKDRHRIEECIEFLRQHGIAVKTKPRIHQKYAVIDRRIVWYGSINLLSYGISEESIMRIESEEIAGELLYNEE
ncbi:MAG: DEAD/DEAH box helicase family protein [Oscillospiraceae bacterium]|nr:DEAD/DEAH box helicase family protein [Oscillospiraceae bacterium]